MSSFIEPKVGAPHFSSKLIQARSSGYNLATIINELIDFPVLNSNSIDINFVFDNSNKLYSIKVSDECDKGFENILSVDSKSPFNFGHVREGHSRDDDISEFGTGMKQSAVAMANKFTIFTRVGEQYYKVVLDFVAMSNEEDVSDSYNPTSFSLISKEEYHKVHTGEYGSTLLLQEILPDIVDGDEETILENCRKNIRETRYI